MNDETPNDAPGLSDDNPIPIAADEPVSSYSMLEPRMKRVYGAYHKERES